ncbi:hypothetical protein C8R43DRAFT_949413 [Mycena crocata]|nr:hypothetical protein C8R43DRAFT_949413 [Mycena crocata]
MDPRRAHQCTHAFIDDIAEDDASLVSDGEEPDPDSMEGQAMALDRRDYNLQDEIADHEQRVLRRDYGRRDIRNLGQPWHGLDEQEWERLHGTPPASRPVAGPSNLCPRSPPRSMPPPPLFLPDSRDPTPYKPRDPRDLTPFVPPVYQPRPPLVPRPPSSVPPPLFLGESRDSTPFQPRDPRDITPFVPPVYQPGAPFGVRQLTQSKRKRGETPEEEEEEHETTIRVPDVDSSDEDETNGEDDGEEPEREEDSALEAIKLERKRHQFFDDTALLDSDEDEDDDEHLDDALEETAEDRAFIDDTDHHEVPPRLVRTSSDADAEVAAMQQEAAKYDDKGVAYQPQLAQEEEEQEDRTTDLSWLDRDLTNITHPDWNQRQEIVPHRGIRDVAQERSGAHAPAFSSQTNPPLQPPVIWTDSMTHQHRGKSRKSPSGEKGRKKPEKVEIPPVPRRTLDKREKPPLSKKLTAEQEQEKKEKERYWEYHQAETEPLTWEQLVAESQQTSALILTASKPRLLRPVQPSIDDLVPLQPLRPLVQFLLPRRGEVLGQLWHQETNYDNDKRENSFGTILLIRDTPQFGGVVKVLGSRRLTLDYQLGRSREQLEDLLPASLFKAKGSKRVIWKIRRHPLDPTPPVRIGDRLCVVDDKHLEGTVGRVEGIDLEDFGYRGEMVTIRTTDGKIARLRTDAYHQIFYAGDEVEIVRGAQSRQHGIVMEVLFSGVLVDATPTANGHAGQHHSIFRRGGAIRGQQTAISTLLGASQRCSSSEIENEIRVHLGLAEDRKREADNKRMMGVGRCFKNVTVFIYKGPNKGCTGKVIGDHDTQARRDREQDLRKRKNTMELDDTAGIILTPPAASGESVELWVPGPSRPPRLAPKWPETLPVFDAAEADGTWLASSKLLHKRLDVHIFGVLGAPGAISVRGGVFKTE